MKKLSLLFATAALLVGSAVVGWTSPAAARGGGAVVATGNCSGSADWKLKAKARDGRIEVEFEVDSNRNGQAWDFALSQNGAVVAGGRRVTLAPSGSFSIERRVPNATGPDVFVGSATNVRTGQTCNGTLTF